MRKFDLDNDARLNYDEFANAILASKSKSKNKDSHRKRRG